MLAVHRPDPQHDRRRLWTADLNLGGADPDDLRFIVQAANGAALVGIDDNKAAYHSLASVAAGTPAATALDLTAPASGAYGANAPVSAKLTQGASNLSGKMITFRIGTSIATGVTNASGIATASLSLTATPGVQQIVATFAGEPTRAQSSDTSPITVSSLGTSLTLTSGPSTGANPGAPSGVSAVLTAGTTPIAGRTITFVATGSGATAGQGFVKSVTTNATGVGALGSTPTVPGGAYSITAYFSGTIPLHPWGPPPASITLDDPVYQPSVSLPGVIKVHWPFTGFFSPVDNPPTLNVAKAGSTIPVKFSIGGDYGLSILAVGSPKLVKITCSTTLPTDVLEELSLEASGLKFTGGQYQWNWKTAKTDTGCWRLDLILVDGQTFSANFQFK